MRKNILIIMLLILTLTSCTKKNIIETPDTYTIPKSIIEENNKFFNGLALDEKTVLIINDVEAFVYDVEIDEKTVLIGLSKDNAEKLYHVDIEKQQYYLHDSSSVSVMSFSGEVISTLHADDGYTIIEWNGLWISLINESENTPIAPIKIYNDDLNLVQEISGKVHHAKLGELREIELGFTIKNLFITSIIDGEEILFYYHQEQAKFVESEVQIAKISTITDSYSYEDMVLIVENDTENTFNYYLYKEGTLNELSLKDVDNISYNLYHNFILGIGRVYPRTEIVYDLEGNILLELSTTNIIFPSYIDEDVTLYVELDDTMNHLYAYVKNYDGEVVAEYDLSEITDRINLPKEVKIINKENLIIRLDDINILIKDSKVIELELVQNMDDDFCIGVRENEVFVCQEETIISIRDKNLYNDIKERYMLTYITEFYAILRESREDHLYDLTVYNLNGKLLFDGYIIEKINSQITLNLPRLYNTGYTIIYDTLSESYVILCVE